MCGHADHRCAHAVLTDTEVDLATFGGIGAEHAHVGELGAGVAGDVGTATDDRWVGLGEGLEDRPGRLAGSDGLAWLPRRHVRGVDRRRGLAQQRIEFRTVDARCRDTAFPCFAYRRTTHTRCVACSENVGVDVEGFVCRDAKDFFGRCDLLVEDRIAVHGRRASRFGSHVTDLGLEND